MVNSVPQTVVNLGAAERRAVDRVLRSGKLVQGEEVAAFENEFSAIVAGRGCAAVNSGTSALHLGMLAAGIGPGDEVIVPAFTYAGTVNAVRLTGARPVYCDIDERTYCASAESVGALIGPRTAAILIVHLFGHPADMDALSSLAERAGVALFEDACQAHGAAWRGRPVGSFGTFAAFSFYPTKNMTTGEGGMIVSADAGVLDRARLLRNQGARQAYQHQIVGFNNRMTESAAAIGRVQLPNLARWNAARRDLARRYSAVLSNVRAPHVDPAADHVFHQYSVRVPDGISRDGVREELRARQVGTGAYYPVPCHRLEPLRAPVDLPVTDAVAETIFALPIFPTLRRKDLLRVAREVDDLTAATGYDRASAHV
ncbi:DegT/DnrJ/EryC1/StrS aminotransferase family protein [Nocardia sp. BMG51109]|uniref:DegT/DnrJ/EryC1/StrS family aminotransferase n=1 Tax=Nocardia sp. BMG51109 TaxID=1056816 RepID=UPI000463B6CC|nr:DegT/DnrJ/EryC1/StrS family aminotransferase [Nocardia sp. BMG51109]